jgi:hypothetical protein
MAASYPTSTKTFTPKTDNVDIISAATTNEAYEEIIAIETDLRAGLPVARGGTGLTALGTVGQTLMSNGSAAYWQDKTHNIYENAIVDSSCQIAQNTATVNISTSYQYGHVDLVKMKCGGTVGAGTIAQGTAIGKNLTSAKASGVTLTGSGAVWAKVFIEAADAKKLKNLTESFSVQVKHDVGSNVNYYVYINKANSADNFAAETNISTSSAIAVATGTETTIKLENVAMGDCSNGISIEIKSDCGEVTTKNFEFTDFKLEKGISSTVFSPSFFENELLRSQHYYEKSYNYSVAIGTVTYGNSIHVMAGGVNFIGLQTKYNVPKRIAVQPSIYSINGTINKVTVFATITDVATADCLASYYGISALGCILSSSNQFTASTTYSFHYVVDARF